MDLRPYQTAAVNAVYDFLRKREDNPCVVLPTASGKSLVLARIASDAASVWKGRVLILAHVKELLEQNADKVRRLCPGLDVGLYSAGLDSRDTKQPVICAGIQSVYNKADKLGRFDLIIIDEAHCVPTDGEGMYRTFLDAEKKINPDVRLIGLTATPYRLKGGLICKPENLLNEVCYEAGIRELIGQGYLSPITAKYGRLDANWDALHVRAGEFVSEDVENAVNSDKAVDQSVRDLVNKAKNRKSIIVFCSSVSHCERVAKQIRTATGEEVGVVTGETPVMERAELLARFRREKRVDLFGEELPPLRWLCNMGVLTTGFDAPCIDCVALLRPTKSPGLYVQMCLDAETEILSYRGWAKMGSLSVGDPVYSFDVGTGRIRPDEVVSVVSRLTDPNERFIAVRAPHLDIRTTSLHDFIYRNRNARWNWLKKTGEELALQKDSFLIPVAGWAPQDDTIVHANLTDDEIRFVGWAISDGCVNKANNTICISQSSKSPYVADIEKMLNGCGFGWSLYVHHYKGDLAKYPPNYRYIIPFGRSRKTGRRGWKDLEPRIRRRPLEAFADFSARQLWILLEAMNLANGSKQKEIDWIPRGFNICFGDKFDRASDIQALCVMRGFRCNLSAQRGQVGEFHVHGKAKDQTIMRVKPQLDATIGGANSKGRCKFEFERPQMPERVWCIETHAGTIVTRRHGKVAILGNCGRGFRLSPETGKTNCLVLDFGGNIARHGPVDCVAIHESVNQHRNEPEHALVKKCPECDEFVHTAIMVCPSCGYEWPKRSPELEALARNGGVLSGEPTDCDVSKVYYSVHEKKNAPPDAPRTMQVDYMEDMTHKAGSTWVCFEHPVGSYPRRKAERWWRDHCNIGAPMPMDAADAVRLANMGALREVTSVTLAYFVGRKWPEVVGDKCADAVRFDLELEPGSDLDVPLPPPKPNAWEDPYDDLPF